MRRYRIDTQPVTKHARSTAVKCATVSTQTCIPLPRMTSAMHKILAGTSVRNNSSGPVSPTSRVTTPAVRGRATASRKARGFGTTDDDENDDGVVRSDVDDADVPTVCSKPQNSNPVSSTVSTCVSRPTPSSCQPRRRVLPACMKESGTRRQSEQVESEACSGPARASGFVSR